VDVLEGIQVIDLSHGIAGPIVGMFLADFGAEVVKVEPPAGDPARGEPGFAAWNRGKKGVVIDPSDAARRRWLAELIAGACYATPGRLASFSRTPRFGPMRSPGIGEHARDVLRTAGLTDPEVDELISSGTVTAHGPLPQSLPTAYR
jgi:crotonobetainyl-CoA:carnitine CoA-transferase CaiB-like acyl-CoA transferase